MSSNVIRMNRKGQIDLAEVCGVLKEKLGGELVNETSRGNDDFTVRLLTIEKFYLRSKGYAALTVMITEVKGVQTADVIGSAGGEGLLNISWGANAAFAELAAKILEGCGFQREPDDNPYFNV